VATSETESPLPDAVDTDPPRRALGPIVGLAATAVAAALAAAVPELRHSISLALHGNFDGLRAYVHHLGVGGLALLLALMLAHAIIWYPTEIVTATAGFVYGFLPGLGLVTAGWVASALVSYVLGLVLGRPLLCKLLGHRFTRLEHAVQRGGTSLLLSARLIPVVPFSLMGYVAGATRVRVWRFTWTTVVGYLPLTAAVAYLGSRAKTLSAGDPVVWLAALLVVVLLLLARRVNIHRL
jgi:uncharacterized membrane protein YdjX (TVP38/TMEM64 family)